MELNNKDLFPLWKPQKFTLIKINGLDRKLAKSTFRNSCSSFISRDDVRNYLLNKYSNECVFCNSKDNLQIDHILSAHQHFVRKMYYECNLEGNLQVLCKKCNTSKIP